MKTLQTIRVSERTLSNIEAAIKKYNKKSLVQMSHADFRRLAYELLSQLILQDKPIPVQLSQA